MSQPELTLVLIGFGNVARRFLRLLEESAERLDFTWKVVAISTKHHGSVINMAGIEVARAIATVEGRQSLDRLDATPHERSGIDVIRQVADAAADEAGEGRLVCIETTLLDIDRGEPAVSHVRAALEGQAHVVTANKGPAAFAYHELEALAESVDRIFFFEGAVMDGVVVTEKAFDEFHLYTLAHPATLRDKETKQVEFVRATGVKAERIYVFEGRGNTRRGVPGKVQVFREFRNTEANKLGLALPKGKVRFYSQDGDRQLEFVGENTIDHTPKGEVIRVLTGNSFDLVGERRQVNQTEDGANRVATQTIEVKLRNRKAEPVVIRVREHATRGGNWTLTAQSQPHEKVDATTFEFAVPLQPNEEKVVTYTIRTTW